MAMDIEKLERIKSRYCEEMCEIGEKDPNRQNIEAMQMLSAVVKNLGKIIMMEDGSESMGDWAANGSYRDGYSGRRMHYVRGHYSRADGMSNRGYSRDGYSRGSYGTGNNMMLISKLTDAMGAAENEEDRASIRELIDQLK